MPRSRETSQKMREESRSALLAAASALFARLGYFNCSIGDIARQARMSQGNVYWYFASKEELLLAVLSAGFDALDELMHESNAPNAHGLEKIERLVDGYIRFCEEHADFLTIHAGLLSHGGAALLKELGIDVQRIQVGYRQSLQDVLLQAEQEGDLSPGSDLRALSAYFFAFFNGLVIMDGEMWGESEMQVRRAVYRLLDLKPGQRGDTRRYGKWERG
jgi:AcrR family transcriptional regulator